MYNHDVSSSKQGMSIASPLIIFKHVETQGSRNAEQNSREAKLGCASAHRLYSLFTIEKKDGIAFARDIKDYNLILKLSELPRGIELEIKEEPFSEIVHGDAVKEVATRYGIIVS